MQTEWRKYKKRFNNDLEELKSKQTMMNNTINEIKNTLEAINSRITEAEEWISNLEDKILEITTAEQNKEKIMKRIEDNLRDLWYNIKHTKIRIIGVPEEEEKKKGSQKIFEEIIVENFPNMGKEIVNQVQEAQRVPYRINPRTLHNDQGINPRRRYNNCKYLCTQHRSSSIHKVNANSHKRGNRQ